MSGRDRRDNTPRTADPAPTVREVAERAGVSPMTVSRTLAGGKNVREELQDRVLTAVEELGYRRNENARSLRPGHASGLIGVAITNVANPYYGMFTHGVEEVADEAGRRIQFGSTSENSDRERQLVGDFVGRKVEGLIVVPVTDSGVHLQPRAVGGAPVVLATRAVSDYEFDTVLVDDVESARASTTVLLDRGHTRIAFLGPGSNVFTAKRRLEGFIQALDARGLSPHNDPTLHRLSEVAEARMAADSLLESPNAPTAIFCANNRSAVGALQSVLARRRYGHADTAVISFDDFELSEAIPTPLVIVKHDARQLGREAAQLLFARLVNPNRLIEVRQVPTELALLNL